MIGEEALRGHKGTCKDVGAVQALGVEVVDLQ